MLKVTKLTKQFKTASGSITPVKDLSFEIPEGSFAAIIGKSGSGKSTLLALLGALDKPTSGTIEVGENNITKWSDSKLTKYRRTAIGFVFQSFNLIPNLTALENVMLPMEYAGIASKQSKERAVHLLNQVGLVDDKQQRKPARLSGGEQQRVAIARALANKPKLILADEPTGNLDSQTGRVIIDLMHDLAKSEKTTIVVVTHDMGLAEEVDITLRLKDGKLTNATKSATAQLMEPSL